MMYKKKPAMGNKLILRPGKTNSYSITKYNKWTRRDMKGVDCSHTIQYLSSARITSALGFQDILDWWACVGGSGGYPAADPGNQSQEDMRKIIWNTFGNVTTTSGWNNRKIFLHKLEWEFELVNTAQIPANIEFYECIARRDHSDSPVTRITEGVTREMLGGASALASPAYQTYGVSPFDSGAFCQYFKVLKKSSIVLLPGRQHKYNMFHQIKRAYNAEDLEGGDTFFKGVSRVLLMRVWGSLVNDDTVKTAIHAGTVAVDVVARKKIFYGIEAPMNPQMTSIYNNLTTPSGISPESFINAETGNTDTSNTPA